MNERNIKFFSQNNGFEILYSFITNLPKIVSSNEIKAQNIQNESEIQFLCDVENNFKIALAELSLWFIRDYLIYNEDGLKNMGVNLKYNLK